LFALEERGFSRAVTALKQLFVILRKREPRLRGERDEGPDAFQPLATKAMRQLNVRRQVLRHVSARSQVLIGDLL
jgi:hypothetical protein